MTMAGMGNDPYVIVGAGVFGSSLALHLIQKYPSANVTLVDRSPFPSQTGASWDWNKVVRADYSTMLYMELGLEAMKMWRSDALYQPFYHESGLAWLENSGLSHTIIENFRKLNATDNCRLAEPAEVRKLWDGIHSDANYEGVTGILVNESSGWAAASRCLAKVIETAIAAGVNYTVANVQEVLFDEKGSSVGVRATDGTVLSGSRIILATGALTAKILADSAPRRKEMHVGGRLIAAAVTEGTVRLSDEDAKYFRKGPVFFTQVGDVLGGAIPANEENLVKFYRDVSFTNTVHHEASGSDIGVPPDLGDYGQWDLTPSMKRGLDVMMHTLFGEKSTGWEFETRRICWDAITPTQDPIICEHPHSKGLYIATGGSFHCWKFLPIIGKYALQMLDGTLDAKLAERWAWDRENEGSAHGSLLPDREMKDV